MLNPEICTGKECARSIGGMPYCTRCILSLKHAKCPAMSNREIFEFYDSISRTRALSEPESILLEYGMKVTARDDAVRARKLAA